MNKNSSNKIKFLGTAGARFVTTRQLRASGGIWFSIDNTEFLVDPGPGTLVHALNSSPPMEPTKLSGIILSHRHLDHSNDFNIMVEAMTEGGHKKRGEIFLPNEALSHPEPVFFSYLHEAVDKIHILQEKKSYKIGNVDFETSPYHDHLTETYGFKFHTTSGIIAHITDTKYFKEIIDFYKADILIVNVVCYHPKEPTILKNPIIKHLYFTEIEEVIKELRPRLTILTHFGLNMLKANPCELADNLSQRTNLKIVAASDGMELEV